MTYATCKPHAVTTLVTDSTIEPVTLERAKFHLGITDPAEDPYVGQLIATARTHCERDTNRSFITKTWKQTLDYFPSVIYLRFPPIVAITSLTYLNASGSSVTLGSSSYRLDSASEPGRLFPAYGTNWPSTYPVSGAVTVTYTAGYGASETLVPTPIKWAMLMLMEFWHFNRGAEDAKMPMAVSALLAPYKIAEYT